VLKKTAEKYLPSDLIYRKKVGFGAPLRDWILGDLAGLTEEVLSAENVTRRGLFNFDMVTRMIEGNRRGEQDYSYTIFALLCIELWCQIFVDGTIPDQKNQCTRPIVRL
jgi:asparagine synthase (glutamine-hydrolysing)